MNNIRKLTEEYVKAFNECNLQVISSMMADGFTLSDPEAREVTPKSSALDYIKKLFEAQDYRLSFSAHSILVDGSNSAIHFTLKLKDTIFDGVDIIVWEKGKMISLHAYLTNRA